MRAARNRTLFDDDGLETSQTMRRRLQVFRRVLGAVWACNLHRPKPWPPPGQIFINKTSSTRGGCIAAAQFCNAHAENRAKQKNKGSSSGRRNGRPHLQLSLL